MAITTNWRSSHFLCLSFCFELLLHVKIIYTLLTHLTTVNILFVLKMCWETTDNDESKYVTALSINKSEIFFTKEKERKKKVTNNMSKIKKVLEFRILLASFECKKESNYSFCVYAINFINYRIYFLKI